MSILPFQPATARPSTMSSLTEPTAARAADLQAEQALVDAAYEHLGRMRVKAERLLAEMKGADPDLEWSLTRRAHALSSTTRALCFGRTDSTDGSTWYIGRRHVEDEVGDPVVVEWRAPVALPFYRASWSDPMGLARRRQFVVDGREILSIGDDTFGAAVPFVSDFRGADALLVELERARSGEMLDIVATIQPEQDEVIRAPAAGVLAVQGGPGSGKTAVGLHRAAFLLYADDAMARANVLVVGPNRTFLRYIAQVLPSLGEHAVVQTTFSDLVPEVVPPPGTAEGSDAERVKGDSRMAEVLARAIELRFRHDVADIEVTLGLRRLVVPAAAANAAVDATASKRLPYARARDFLRESFVGALFERYMDLAGPPADGSQLGRTLRTAPGLKTALDRRCPTVAPATLVSELLSRAKLLSAAADGLLTGEEQRLILRRRGRAWTAADGPLVDEAKELIHGRSRTYGYAIVDEAQDLSPMELRMLARRCPAGSLTLLGDIAQAIGPWGLRTWEDLAASVETKKGLEVVELRHGYRSTAQVLDLAARLLPEAAPQVRPVTAVRPGRRSPTVRLVGREDLVKAIVAETSALSGEYEMVGVIVPLVLVDEVVASATAALPRVGEAIRDGLGRPVTVLAAESAKGLEFDAVVVAEPSSIVAERPDRAAGLRLLYVALTRPTQHLAIVHSSPLPGALSL
jgi:DNA helicase IV